MQEPKHESLEATLDGLEALLDPEEATILWIGAGASISAGHPSTHELIEALRNKAAADGKLPEGVDFTATVDAFVKLVGKGPLEDTLQRVFSEARQPTVVHRALARLAKAGCFSAIVSTNYDNLFERALEDEGVSYLSQVLEDNLHVLDQGAVRVLKPHGDRGNWSEAVLSGESYRSFQDESAELVEQLDLLLKRHPVFFVGYSMTDPRTLGWLVELGEDERGKLKRWRPLMTQASWEDAAKEGGEALTHPPTKALLVRNYEEDLPKLLTDLADRLAPNQSTRLDLTLTVDGKSWHIEAEGTESLEREDPLGDDPDDSRSGKFDDDLETLRKYDHQPVPTDPNGFPTQEAQARLVNPLQALAAKIGERLTKAILSEPLRERLQAAINASMDREPAHLHLIVKPADLSNSKHIDRANQTLALPWELIRLENDFPVSRGTLDVTREAYVQGLEGLTEPTSELKVVAAVSAPTGVTQLNYEEESYRLSRALGEDRLEVTDLGTVDELIAEVKKLKPPVLHFTGHGAPGKLYFESETGEKDPVLIDDLLDRLRGEAANFPRLMYLACCYGATSTSGPSSAGEPPSGTREGQTSEREAKMVDPMLFQRPSPATAATLHRSGIHQVLGYFGPVGDLQSTQVSEAFYEALAEESCALKAVRRARQQAKRAIEDHGNPTHVYPLGWAQVAFYQRGEVTKTSLPISGSRKSRSSRHARDTEPLSESVKRLRLGFVGRRRDRSSIVKRWKDGDRCVVVLGLGGLGKTALCTEMAPILAERLLKNDTVPILALSGRDAKANSKRDSDLVFQLWEQVAASRTDEEWQKRVAAVQENGITGDSLSALIHERSREEGGVLVYLDDAESLQKPLGRVANSTNLELGQWATDELYSWWKTLCQSAKPGETLGVLASSRYLPQGTPKDSEHPLGELSKFEIEKMMSWFPNLGRLPSMEVGKLSGRTDGHPRTIEYLDGLVSLREEKIAPPGGYQGSDWWEELIEPALQGLPEKLDADLLLTKLWEALPQDSQAHLGRCCCVLGPVPFDALTHLEPEKAEGLTQGLVRLGLLSPEAKGNAEVWAPHRLVVEEVATQWKGDRKAVFSKLQSWFERTLEAKKDVLALFEAANYAIAAENGSDAWKHVRRICASFRQMGRYREALEWAKRMKDIDLPVELEAESHHELGMLYWHLGKNEEARKLQEKVLELRRRILGEEHPSTLTSMNNLASTLKAQGDLDGARSLQEKVLELRRRIQGEEHPDTLTSMSNLALTLNAQGDLDGARSLEEKELGICRRIQGEEHPDTLVSMNNLAGTLQAQGDLDGARSLKEKVLELRRRILGEEHPNTLGAMSNLALTLQAQGDLDGARKLEEKVLELRRRILGEEHPSTLTSMNNLAATLWTQEDLDGARRLEEKVLEVRKRTLGEEHPSTLTSMNSLAGTLQAQGDLDGARLLYVACLRGFGRVLGSQHPTFQTVAGNCLGLLKKIYPGEEQKPLVERLTKDLQGDS